MARSWAVAWLWVCFAVAGACTRLQLEQAPPGVSIGQSGYAGEAAGGDGSSGGERGNEGGGAPLTDGGAPPSIELGIWPTYASEPGSDPDALATLSAVSALSAGSALLPLLERWDVLSSANGSPRAPAWTRLDALVQPYREAGRKVALCIAVVDRTLDARPFAGELDTSAARSAIQRTIDEVLAHFANELSHLCFGYEVDRFVSKLTLDERGKLLAFIEHAVAYASDHPQRSLTTGIGVAVTLEAIASDQPSGIADFIGLGDEVVAVYDPLTTSGELKPPESITSDLEAALSVLGDRASSRDPARRLSLFEVGYPSAQSAESSEKAQKAFYETLFETLDARRGQIAFASVFGLQNRAADDCGSEAAAFGGTSSAKTLRSRARCSAGLWADGSSAAKPAWAAVVSALSRYR